MARENELSKDTLTFLQKLFKIKVNKNARSKSGVITPHDTFQNKDGKDAFISKDTFPPQVQRLYDFWVTTYFNIEKYKERIDLWEQMQNLYFNDSICARTVNIRSDEVVQADSNMQSIFAEGNKQQVDFILDFFDRIQLYPKIRPIAFDLEVFGNHVWVLGMNNTEGITEVIPTDIFALTERLEFYPAELERELLKNSPYQNYFTQDRVTELIDAITNKDNITSVHKQYLLGFIINNYVLPPWRVLHFRNMKNRSPFNPFGCPNIIHQLAPYKQWDSAMTFQVMARACSFPVDKYEINLPNVLDETEKFNMLASFIERLDNLGIRQSKKEDKNLGDRIFTIKDLFDYTQISSELDIGKIADIDMLKDERIIASCLPRNIIDPNDSSFGDSGVSLIQKWKELSRAVFHTQHTILDNITQLCKLQMITTNFCGVNDFDFILSMPYPESQMSSDLINNQKETMDLFVAITDMLSDKFLGGEPLPDELLNDILHQVVPYDQTRLDGWLKKIKKAKKDIEAEQEEEELENISDEMTDETEGESTEEISGEDTLELDTEIDTGVDASDVEAEVDISEIDDIKFENKRLSKVKRFKENLKKHQMKFSEAVNDASLKIRQKKYREGVFWGRHYFSSKNNYSDFQVDTLRNIDKKLLKEFDEKYQIEDSIFTLINKKKKEK